MSPAGNVANIVLLPFEILEIFVSYAPLESQLAICRVSRLFRSLTLRSLYQDISLRSPSVVVHCCRTLASNPDAAATVRSLSISYTYQFSTNPFLASYYSVIRQALQSLPEVHTLKLLIYDPYFVTLLDQCLFPCLRQFECFLTPSLTLMNFLNRHPTIDYLQVSSHEDTLDPSEDDCPVPLPQLDLPQLRYFSGNVQGAALLGQMSRLRAAFLSWHAMGSDPDVVLAGIQRSSRDSLRLLSCQRRGWNLDLFEAASIRLANIVSLHISNVLLVDSSPTETYLQAIRTFLPRFKQLRRFWLNCIDYWEMGNVTCQIDRDSLTVTEWGAACVSLQEVSLPHSGTLPWYRLSGNVWIPDPQHPTGREWLENALPKRHATWALLLHSSDRVLGPLPSSHSNPGDYDETLATVKRNLSNLIKERVKASTVPTSPASVHILSAAASSPVRPPFRRQHAGGGD